MASTVQLKLDNRWLKQARGQIDNYTFDVGVLKDRPHKLALSSTKGLKTVAGGSARKTSRRQSGLSISEVSAKLRAQTGINFYTLPFKKRSSRDVIRCINTFFDLFLKKGQPRRVENALQAVVRNPIVRGEYGSNSAVTAKIKGFNRFMIDTGQLFNAIKAKVTRVKNV